MTRREAERVKGLLCQAAALLDTCQLIPDYASRPEVKKSLRRWHREYEHALYAVCREEVSQESRGRTAATRKRDKKGRFQRRPLLERIGITL